GTLRDYRCRPAWGTGLGGQAGDGCPALGRRLEGLSRERVAMELLDLGALVAPAPAVARMYARGVLPVILPEAERSGIGALEAVIAEEARQGVEPHPLRRLAALLPEEPAVAELVAARLRLSTAQRKRLVAVADRGTPPGDPRALAYRIGRDEAADRLLLAGADTSSLAGWVIPAFPLKGGEIVARGVNAGPEVARILRQLESQWVDEGFPERPRVLALLDQRLGR